MSARVLARARLLYRDLRRLGGSGALWYHLVGFQESYEVSIELFINNPFAIYNIEPQTGQELRFGYIQGVSHVTRKGTVMAEYLDSRLSRVILITLFGNEQIPPSLL